MSDRNLGSIHASTINIMPTTGSRWLVGEVEGGGEFQMDVSNTDPILTLKVTIPGVGEYIERIDVTHLLNHWVYGIVKDAARNSN